MRKAWAQDSVETARSKLNDLADQLEADHPGGASSIREGLEETLTLIALGVNGSLLRTLCSTNPIENIQGTLQRVARNVKRWRGGAMALRWAVAALAEAEKNFRRVKGYKDMPRLIAALEAQVPQSSVTLQRKTA